MKKLMVFSAASIVAVSSFAKWGDIGKFAAKEATAAAVKIATDVVTSEQPKDEVKKVATSEAKGGRRDAQEAVPKKEMEATKKPDTAKGTAGTGNAQDEIASIKSDAEFYAAFKKTSGDERKKLFERARQMEDESLLADFVRNNPTEARSVAEMKYYNVKTSDLASALLDNMQGLSLEGRSGWVSVPGLDKVLFGLAQKLDSQARAKYLEIARANREAAKDDELVLANKFYVNMPVIDYVMISLEENLAWTKEPGAVVDNLDSYADMKTGIDGKDWKKEWKIKSLLFRAKERHKYFKVKGTHDGLLEFLKKNVDDSATNRDITCQGNWWQYNDDAHELRISMNDKFGTLNVYRQ